jgi:Glycosyl hydrolase catalytic core
MRFHRSCLTLVMSVLVGACSPKTLTAIGGRTDGGSGAHAGCKRGVATNTAPGAAFSAGLGWWYNWALQPSGADVGIEFVPMVWGSASVGTAIPAGSKYLLGFNEPNFHAQSNLTAQQAASAWPMLEAQAAGAPIVSPAMNFCGPASQCNGTDPYQYLKDFFAACPGCQVDYVAVHWYNCDLPSLKDYLEPGGGLEGFEQFGKPIWLTEFSCGPDASVAEQEAYMRAAVAYLESNPKVFRYSWFSAGPIPSAQLLKADGSPTALGQVYIDLPESCP